IQVVMSRQYANVFQLQNGMWSKLFAVSFILRYIKANSNFKCDSFTYSENCKVLCTSPVRTKIFNYTND
ncbi:unnamed protein product, partial [Ceratitis capitata]